MKPNELYLGVTELFAVLIPGLLVSLLVVYSLSGIEAIKGASTVSAMVMLAIAYPIGLILFSAGSIWDEVYDKFNKKDDENDPYLKRIRDIRTAKDPLQKESPVNKYKWSRAMLSSLHPGGYSEVLRHEADSKLFRSLILPILAFIFPLYQQHPLTSLLALIIAWLAYRMFRRERSKSCLTAYTHIFALHEQGKI